MNDGLYGYWIGNEEVTPGVWHQTKLLTNCWGKIAPSSTMVVTCSICGEVLKKEVYDHCEFCPNCGSCQEQDLDKWD